MSPASAASRPGVWSVRPWGKRQYKGSIMFRHTLAAVAGLCLASSALAQTGLTALFDEKLHDFGTVQRGPMLAHTYRLTNTTRDTLRVQSVRVSCGCVTAQAAHAEIAPGGSSYVSITMDTRRFTGVKTVNIF